MCSGSTTHIINGTQTLVLHTGDLLFLNQAAYHEILPASEGDVGVNFIILPQFFDRSFRMLEQENVLRDFLISTLAGESAFAGYLHIAAHDILPVQNLLENMIWTLLEKKPGVNVLNQTTMGLLLLNLAMFAEDINRTAPGSREESVVFTALKYIETSYKTGTLEELAAQLHLAPYHPERLLKHHNRAELQAAAAAAPSAAGGLSSGQHPPARRRSAGSHRLRKQQLFLPHFPGKIRLFPRRVPPPSDHFLNIHSRPGFPPSGAFLWKNGRFFPFSLHMFNIVYGFCVPPVLR